MNCDVTVSVGGTGLAHFNEVTLCWAEYWDG